MKQNLSCGLPSCQGTPISVYVMFCSVCDILVDALEFTLMAILRTFCKNCSARSQTHQQYWKSLIGKAYARDSKCRRRRRQHPHLGDT
eukprot:1916914-Ditylum_brightwellii.AAC.1